MTNDWTRHAKGKRKKEVNRRLALSITPRLEVAMSAFRNYHSSAEFTDTAIIMTMIEAGFQKWADDIKIGKDTKKKPSARVAKNAARPESGVANGDPNIDPEEVGYDDYEADEQEAERNEIPYTP